MGIITNFQESTALMLLTRASITNSEKWASLSLMDAVNSKLLSTLISLDNSSSRSMNLARMKSLMMTRSQTTMKRKRKPNTFRAWIKWNSLDICNKCRRRNRSNTRRIVMTWMEVSWTRSSLVKVIASLKSSMSSLCGKLT